jgi:hypothetical protein
LLTDARTSEDVRQRATATYATLRLLKTIREIQQELVGLADRPAIGEAAAATASTLEQFLSGLRTAWQEGEVRPTSKPKEKARRGRRRPDPLVTVTALVRDWFEAEPWRTRIVRAAATSSTWRLPRRAAPDATAPGESVAV